MHSDGGPELAWRRRPARAWEPPVDVLVSSESVWIRLEAPGVAVTEVRVALRGREVELRGRRAVARLPPGAEFVRAEIALGEFLRRIELPWHPSPAAVELSAADGIVEVRLRRGASR